MASGLSLGKEGYVFSDCVLGGFLTADRPFVHIATCIGNIACRLFDKYNYNDGKDFSHAY